MNDISHKHSTSPDDDLLGQLFTKARSEQTELVDDNFTKLVLNSLPSKRQAMVLLQESKKQYLPDLIGFFIGLIAVFILVEPATLANTVLSLLPDVSISFMTITSTLAFVSLAAAAAWWSVERSPSF